jgi:hypothetical protein
MFDFAVALSAPDLRFIYDFRIESFDHMGFKYRFYNIKRKPDSKQARCTRACAGQLNVDNGLIIEYHTLNKTAILFPF